MKANELMTGDWVNIYVFPNENPQIEDLFPTRIGTIMTPLPSENSGEHIECIFKAKDGGIGCAARPVETCLPIPLTAEILEKNGWKDISDHTLKGCETFKLHYEQKGFDYYITIKLRDYFKLESYDDRFYTLCEMEFGCRFVHELQHALRLCGLKDLADNFKIE